MNTSKAKKKEEKKERDYIEIRDVEVSNVRVVSGKNGGDLVFFTLKLNGVSINNCRVATTKDGKDFITFPQYKGSNGQYYNTVYCAISEEDSEKILTDIQAQLDNQ